MTSEEDPGSSVAAESVSKMDSIQSASANDSLSSHRVFKKSSPNNKLTLYLSSRDLVVSQGRIDRLQGVLLVDPEFLENKKVYGQVTLTFRYGREDEEVMGLKFCNEAIMCLAQLYPPPEPSDEYIPEPNTPLQEALIKRLGPNAYPFNMEITPLAPPSVQLVPAKEYNGAPIGTSYDIRAYVADRADEKLHRRTTVRMGIRVVQRAYAPPSPYLYVPGGGGKTGKEKAKQNKKALLFGCKSSPLESQFPRDEPFGISRSVEAVGGSHCVEDSPQHGISRSCGTVVERITREKNKPKDNSANPTITIDEAADTKNVSFKNGDIEDSASTSDVPERQMATLALENDTKYSDSDNEESESKFSSLDRHRYLCGGKRPSLAAYLSEIPAPTATVEKPFLLSDGKVCLTASLDKAIYSHGEEIQINVKIQNNSNKTVRRIKVKNVSRHGGQNLSIGRTKMPTKTDSIF
ncbi:unnamed protein product [Brassicogethes aeneus]|uniref:Uncharacterized protein n=1 Tax=Brassicogethes aeneus TaxID=1431903 RepID=A0A9P0FM81_BRAAE|nr:unnamed protein product [Brassicogethes aeneus]